MSCDGEFGTVERPEPGWIGCNANKALLPCEWVVLALFTELEPTFRTFQTRYRATASAGTPEDRGPEPHELQDLPVEVRQFGLEDLDKLAGSA